MTVLDAETETDEFPDAAGVALRDEVDAAQFPEPARFAFSEGSARSERLTFSRVAGWLCLCVAFGLVGLSWISPAPLPENRTAGASAPAPLKLVPIRDIEVGVALPARDNPSGDRDTRFGPIDPATWRLVELTGRVWH